MKKIIIIALALVSLQSFAQEKKEKHNKAERAKKMMNLPAEDMASYRTKQMTLALDLTQSQQEKIQKINFEKVLKRKAMITERKAKKESGEIKKLTPEERLKRKNASLDDKIATKAKMKDILNDEQYAKWEKLQNRMTMKGKNRGLQKAKQHK